MLRGDSTLATAVRRRLTDQGPAGTIPDAAEGDVRHEVRTSSVTGDPVGFFTAVPAGHGAGEGLPVCLVLHGASATTADFRRFGLARSLSPDECRSGGG